MTILFSGYEASSKGIIKTLEGIIEQNPSWDDISDTFSTAHIFAIIASGEESAYVWDKILKWITMAGTDEQKQILIKNIVLYTEAIDF